MTFQILVSLLIYKDFLSLCQINAKKTNVLMSKSRYDIQSGQNYSGHFYTGQVWYSSMKMCIAHLRIKMKE